MNGRLVTQIAIKVCSGIGILFLTLLTAMASKNGWDNFGKSEWKNSPEDDELAREEYEQEMEDYPELYDDIKEADMITLHEVMIRVLKEQPNRCMHVKDLVDIINANGLYHKDSTPLKSNQIYARIGHHRDLFYADNGIIYLN